MTARMYTVKDWTGLQSEEASVLWSRHDERRELSGERDIARNGVRCTQARKTTRTAWMDNIKTWTRPSVEASVRMTEDRDERGKFVHGVTKPRIEDGAKNGTEQDGNDVGPSSAISSREQVVDSNRQ